MPDDKTKILVAKPCPPETFRDPEDPKRCIPFSVLLGDQVTIFQGPDCWPKQFTIRKPFDPAVERVILREIQREMDGATQATLLRDLAATPRLLERVRASGRKPK